MKDAGEEQLTYPATRADHTVPPGMMVIPRREMT